MIKLCALLCSDEALHELKGISLHTESKTLERAFARLGSSYAKLPVFARHYFSYFFSTLSESGSKYFQGFKLVPGRFTS